MSIKKLLFILWIISPAYIFATYTESQQNYFVPTQEPVLTSYQGEWKTKFEWTKAQDQDFSYYKLVYSQTNSSPKYPEDWYVFVGSDINSNSSYQESKNWYWRVCTIYKWFYANNNDDKYRKCSNVIKVENTTSSDQTIKKPQIEQKKYNIKTYNKQPNNLSESIKTKLDTIVTNFKNKLDTKLSTNEEKLKTINSVLEKLREKSKNSPKIYMYVISKIEEIKSTFQEDTSEVESILDF